VSFQIGVLKVLSAHQNGCASVDAIKRDLATLASREWSAQLRRLAALAPKIDAFSAGLIVRTPDAWQITDVGRALLTRIESGERIELANITASKAAVSLSERPQRPLNQYRPNIDVRRRDILPRIRRPATIAR